MKRYINVIHTETWMLEVQNLDFDTSNQGLHANSTRWKSELFINFFAARDLMTNALQVKSSKMYLFTNLKAKKTITHLQKQTANVNPHRRNPITGVSI